MINTIPDRAYDTICPPRVDITLFQDPTVSWHVLGLYFMVFLVSWYVWMAFGASSIIPLSNQFPNGDFGINCEVIFQFDCVCCAHNFQGLLSCGSQAYKF
jgi:hypothetical protein